MFRNKYINNEDKESFTVNSLVSIFEYLEYLCWKDIKKNILQDYQIELDEDIKKHILEYFDIVKEEPKLINIKNFTDALRKLISRYIAGTRQEIDIKPDVELKLYINKEELWNKNIIENNLFYEEIDKIFEKKILICQCYNLFTILDENINKYEKIAQKQKINKEKNEYEINTNSNQNIINNNRIIDNEDEKDNNKIEESEEDSEEENRNNDDNYDDIY